MLNAVSKICVVYGDELNEEVFKEKVGNLSIKQITRLAKERRRGSMGYAVTVMLFVVQSKV